jgi:hypothetical protein
MATHAEFDIGISDDISAALTPFWFSLYLADKTVVKPSLSWHSPDSQEICVGCRRLETAKRSPLVEPLRFSRF